MTQINLLPWREQARQERKIQFFITMGIFIGLTVFILLIIHLYLSSLIAEKNARALFLQTTLGEKQGQYQALKLKKQQQSLLEDNLVFINKLRAKNFSTVRLMNELTQLIPTTITLEKLSREKNKILLIGKASAELQITQLMKKMAASSDFIQPVLTRINESPSKPELGRLFELQVEQKDRISP